MKKKIRDNICGLEDNNVISKRLWRYVKSTSNSYRIPETLSLDSTTSSDTSVQANLFNQYFYSQFSNESNYNIDMNFENDNDFSISFSTSRVQNQLKNLNVNKACGPDQIPGIVLKRCSKTLAEPLSIIFNTIYNTGMVPSDWKLANVVPIFKKGDKKSVKNYRPISLTCICSKIMERIVQEEILNRTSNLIDLRQHGFIENKSCTTNLISLLEDVTYSLHNKIVTDIIYFDFAKAFDTVNHDILLAKLKYKFKIEGRMLKFLCNFLSSRKQRVVLSNKFSSTLPVMSGVPQGSILGPLLFILFINDIYESISPETNISLYADDTKIWRNMNSYQDCIILQNDINSLNEWCILNKMNFYPDKCKVLSISHKKVSWIDILPFSKFPYAISLILDYVDNERDLGILVNETLSWDLQHNKLITKASQLLGLTKRTCHFVNNKNCRRSLYLALVRSQFEHCSPIWRPCSAIQIEKFEKIQKNAIKWILHEQYLSNNDHEVYHRKCIESNLLPLALRLSLMMLYYSIK